MSQKSSSMRYNCKTALILYDYHPPLQAITGSQLLKLDKRTLSSFGIVSDFRQDTILDAIETLRRNDFSVPKNLHEFMVSMMCVCVCVRCIAVAYSVTVYSGGPQETHIHHRDTL